MNQRILVACSSGVFLSAGLVFLVQPLLAKLLLPEFGGSPSVWNTCTVFFQTVLLLGYCYTWLSTKWLSTRRQIAVHCALLLLTLVQLPVGLYVLDADVSQLAPAMRVLILLAASIGGPYFAVSTTTPLLQHWFSQSNHRLARDPYFFYSISNTGSLLGLLIYPFLLERILELDSQCVAWSLGYGILVGITILCGALSARKSDGDTAPDVSSDGSAEDGLEAQSLPLTAMRRVRWVVLSLVPSAMMLAVTTRITTDVASVPLLWVLPLMAYLATYINAFARRPLVPYRKLLPILFPAFIVIAWMSQLGPGSLLRAGGDIVLFLICGIVLHGELADDRPSTKYLTEYYFWMALGGCLGGSFVGIVAPAVFPSFLELPFVIVLAALIHKELPAREKNNTLTLLRYAWVLLVCGSAIPISLSDVWESALAGASQVVGYAGLAVFYLRAHPRGVALSLALILIPPAWIPDTNNLTRERTFFGVHEVIFEEGFDQNGQPYRLHQLIHGTTLHGEQLMIPPEPMCEPRTYYSPAGPIGQALTAAKIEGKPRHVAVVGLGAGALMAYSEQDEQFDFFEIDPAVRDIATNPDYFRYLTCGEGSQQIIIGDGRIELGKFPEASYDVIVLDAFGSDSIPIHLLTAEALDLFVSRLKPDGVLVVHISNRHLDLEPLLGRYAVDRKLKALARVTAAQSTYEVAQGQQPTQVVAISRVADRLVPLAKLQDWRTPRDDATLWTDSYSSIIDRLTFE